MITVYCSDPIQISMKKRVGKPSAKFNHVSTAEFFMYHFTKTANPSCTMYFIYKDQIVIYKTGARMVKEVL